MRRFLLILARQTSLAIAAAMAMGAVVSMAQVDNASPAEPQSQTSEKALSKPERLDAYFLQLKRVAAPKPARRIADKIWKEWRLSDSPTANQLMEWANEAMQDNRNFIALDLLDQVTVLEPDFAEGWNRRATLHYVMGSHAKSMADINRVLALEPRHFGALMGIASILSAAGSDEAALGTYLKVLEIYPAMRNAQKRVDELSQELAGDDI